MTHDWRFRNQHSVFSSREQLCFGLRRVNSRKRAQIRRHRSTKCQHVHRCKAFLRSSLGQHSKDFRMQSSEVHFYNRYWTDRSRLSLRLCQNRSACFQASNPCGRHRLARDTQLPIKPIEKFDMLSVPLRSCASRCSQTTHLLQRIP